MKEFIDKPISGKRLLTTENGKMYNLYILHEDGQYEEVDHPIIFDKWFDHCINPKTFKQVAENLGCEYTKECFYHITEQYNRNYLNTDGILETSVDGERVGILIHNNVCEINILDNYYTFETLEDLNKLLETYELKPFPTFSTQVDADKWFKYSKCNNESVLVLTKYEQATNVFKTLIVRHSDTDNTYSLLLFEHHTYAELELLDILNSYNIETGDLTDDIFELLSFKADEYGITSMDEIYFNKRSLEELGTIAQEKYSIKLTDYMN